MTDERRRQKRVPVLFDVVWEGKTENYDARTSDLSMGGCFVDTMCRVTTGETLKLRLSLPNQDWVEVEGLVTYFSANVGFGLKFTRLSEAARKKLEKLVHPEVTTKHPTR